MESSKKWAEGPWDLIELPSATRDITAHGAYHVANEMAFAHNCMIRGLNALWQQSPHVSPGQDATDLLFFAHSWAEWITNHLMLEEDHIFPSFEAVDGVPKGALPHKEEQHASFAPGLLAFTTYCGSTDGVDYASTRFRVLIEAFAEPFVSHLHEEIPQLLALDVCGDKGSAGLLATLEAGEAEAAKQDKFIVPPLVFGLRDCTSKGGENWPTTPAVVPYIVNYVFAWRHSGAWRFLPCDHWGIPKPRPFSIQNIEDNALL